MLKKENPSGFYVDPKLRLQSWLLKMIVVNRYFEAA